MADESEKVESDKEIDFLKHPAAAVEAKLESLAKDFEDPHERHEALIQLFAKVSQLKSEAEGKFKVASGLLDVVEARVRKSAQFLPTKHPAFIKHPEQGVIANPELAK